MPKMSGEVLEVCFQAGDTVQAGQALRKIDSDADSVVLVAAVDASKNGCGFVANLRKACGRQFLAGPGALCC